MNATEVWSEYRARIRAFLQSRVSNPADVEDLLQEISIKMFTGLNTLQDQSRLQPWLFQTAHRTIIDFYRQNARDRSVHPEDLWYSENEAETQHALERCVEPFIAALPDDTAELLTAIDIEGQSQKDYATAHGLSYSTLKSRVQAGRKKLRSVFENCCHLSLDARGKISDYRSKSGRCGECRTFFRLFSFRFVLLPKPRKSERHINDKNRKLQDLPLCAARDRDAGGQDCSL